MTLRTTTIASTCAALALACMAITPPAWARWTFHDESLGEKIVPPAGGTRAQTCTGHLEARSGWATFIDFEQGQDPATFEIPAGAQSALGYQVLKAPAGF